MAPRRGKMRSAKGAQKQAKHGEQDGDTRPSQSGLLSTTEV